MHIAFLTTEYPPLPSGGIGTSIRNLARALVKIGHRVTVIGWGANAEFDDQGVQVRFLTAKGYPPKTGWLLSRRRIQQELRRMVHEEALQIVEAPDWCGLSAGIHPGCPLVIRCNGSAVYFAHILREKVRPAVRWAEWLALRHADAVASVSRFTADTTSQLFGLKEKIQVIPNGIDISHFSPAPPEQTEQSTIVYVGTIVRKKGVLDLCRAFSRLVEQLPEARLRLIGRDTPDKQTGAPSTWELCRLELSPAANGRTEYLGPKPYSEVQEHVQRATICVFPSYAEAMPLSWLEAMACAKPLVAYDIGWAGEVIENGSTGLLVAKGDLEQLAETMMHLLQNPALRASLGQSGRKRVENLFSAERVACQSAEWYGQVINGEYAKTS